MEDYKQIQDRMGYKKPSPYSDLHLKVSILCGIIMGIITGVPYINLINCCYLIYLGGGLLAVYIFSRRSDMLRMSDSLIIGIITGFICGLIARIIDAVLFLLGFNQQEHLMETMMSFFENMELPAETAIQLNEQFNEALEMARNQTIGDILKFTLITIIMSIIFTTIGSLIGGLLFKKNLTDSGSVGEKETED